MRTEVKALKDATAETIDSGKYVFEIASAGVSLVPIAIGLWGWWSEKYNPIPWFLGAFGVAAFLVAILFVSLYRVTARFNELKASIANDPRTVERAEKIKEIQAIEVFLNRRKELSDSLINFLADKPVKKDDLKTYADRIVGLKNEVEGYLRQRDAVWFASLNPHEGGAAFGFGDIGEAEVSELGKIGSKLRARIQKLQ